MTPRGAAEEARPTPYAVRTNAGYSGAKLALQLSGRIIRQPCDQVNRD